MVRIRKSKDLTTIENHATTKEMQKKINKYLKRYGFKQFQPQVALFDMDGTVYDSMPNHAIAWQKAMSHYGITFTEQDSYTTEGARGVDTIRHFVRQQQQRDITEQEAQEIYDLKAELFATLPTAAIMPGVTDFMRMLKEKGTKIGIVTGSGQKPLFERVQNDFKEFLTPGLIVTAYDIKHGKPAADPYLEGLRKAGDLQPWQGIVIENAPLGIRAGVAANCFTIAINTGPLPEEMLTCWNPDMYSTEFHQLTQQIKSIL